MEGRGLMVLLRVLAAAACLVLASPAAPAGVAGAPSLCTRLAVRLRRSPAAVARDARASDRGLRPWVRFARAHPVSASALDRQIKRLWRNEVGGAPPTHVQRLQGSDLMRFSDNGADSGDECSQAMYVRRTRGGAFSVLAMPMLKRGPCLRSRQRRGLARVLGQPAYVESAALDVTNSDALLWIAPWLGRDWGRVCPLAIRFSYQATVTHRLYCRAGRAVCVAAGKVAPALGRRYRLYLINAVTAVTERGAAPQIRFAASLTRQQWRLIERAQRLAAANGAPPSPLAQLPLRFVEYFPLQLNGSEYLGAVGPGPSGSEVSFGVFRVPGARRRRLQGLAAFQMRWQPVRLQSIQAPDQRVVRPLE